MAGIRDPYVSSDAFSYTEDLLLLLPVRQVLAFSKKNLLQEFYPRLNALAADQYSAFFQPSCFLIQKSSEYEVLWTVPNQPKQLSLNYDLETVLGAAFDEKVHSIPVIVPLFDVIVKSSSSLQKAFTKVWMRLYSLQTKTVSYDTLQHFYSREQNSIGMDSRDVFFQPSEVLSFLHSLQRIPELYPILLKMLEFSIFTLKQHVPYINTDENEQKLFVKNSLVKLTSEIISFIDTVFDDVAHAKTCVMTCQFLHRIFIEHSNVADEIHKLGYNERLIPFLVENIPSMRKLNSCRCFILFCLRFHQVQSH